MFELIEKIRNKPEKTKNRIAFLSSLLFVGVIFVIWLTVLFPDFLGQNAKAEKITSSEPSAFSALFSTISQGFSDMGKNISQIKEVSSAVMSNFSQGDTTHYFATSTKSDDLGTSTTTQTIEYIPGDTETASSSTDASR